MRLWLSVPGVNTAADVTEAHLAAIFSLNLQGEGITVLRAGDFDGLSTLTRLDLSYKRLDDASGGVSSMGCQHSQGLVSITMT